MGASPESSCARAFERHAFWLEYNGAAYCGSQFQQQDGQSRPTIEGALRSACQALQLPVRGTVILSGRTDAGVHALGQAGHLTLPVHALRTVPDLASALNAHLPADISVREVAYDVGLRFHCRKSARWRWYRYEILQRRQRSSVAPFNASLTRTPLDVARMAQAAACLKGLHDFSSFQSPDSPSDDPMCRVAHAAVYREDDAIKLDIVATRFLYKMVRNLMGLLIAIGGDAPEDASRNALPPSLIADLLASPNRARAASMAPCARANGLSLMAVSYEPHYNLFPDNPLVHRLREILTLESVLS